MKGLISTLLLSFLATFTFAQTANHANMGQNPEAQKLLDASIEAGEFTGVAAGFMVDGKSTWSSGAGYSDEATKKNFDAQTKSRIASITKPMTAIAIMQLYEQGKIDLDQPIQTYLPDFPLKKEGAITIRNLLAHSAGIDDYKSGRERENKKHYATLDDAVDIFKDRKLVSTPGTEFHYTTYGYVVLGIIIEKVSGMTYEKYLQANIWSKAGMHNTGVEHFGMNYPNKSALYHKNGKGKIKQAKPTNLSDRVPGGGVYSCVNDLLLFGNALVNNTLIAESTLKLMLQDTRLKTVGNPYGLGWYLYGQNPKYGYVFGHNGTQTGASAQLMILPEVKTSIIVLSNTSGSMQRASNISVQLFDIAANARS